MSLARVAGIDALGQLIVVEDAACRVLLDPTGGTLDPPPAAFAWPTWLSSGDALVVSTLERSTPGAPGARLLRVPLQPGGAPIELLREPSGTNLVAPRTPHYVNPSPDGRHLLALVPAYNALSLLFVDAAGRGPAQAIAVGAPLFSAWSPASDAYLLHVGGELTLTDLATAPSARSLAVNHAGYRVPSWSPDGEHFLVSAPVGRRVMLQIWDRDGTPRRSLGPSNAGAAFAWSPRGDLIAHAAHAGGESNRYERVRLFPARGGEGRDLYRGEIVAMFWAPDGGSLALLVPGLQEGRIAWLILDTNGRKVRRFPDFDPSTEFALYAAFFDQYALSHSLWSPDGSAILACGRIPSDGPLPELLPSCIYACEIASGICHMLTPGTIAFWPPRSG